MRERERECLGWIGAFFIRRGATLDRCARCVEYDVDEWDLYEWSGAFTTVVNGEASCCVRVLVFEDE